MLLPPPPPPLANTKIVENLVGGAASSSSNTPDGAEMMVTGTRRIYVTAAQCGRTDAGTSAVYVTFNDNASLAAWSTMATSNHQPIKDYRNTSLAIW
jgi:hypothetical protein